jgi:hypothetical protein
MHTNVHTWYIYICDYLSINELEYLFWWGDRMLFKSEIHVIYNNSVHTSQETHYIYATKPNRLMLFRETVAVYCENHTEHTNTLWAECRVLVFSVRTSQETHSPLRKPIG